MSQSSPINLSSSSSSDSSWDDFVLKNPGRVEKEEYEKVVSKKRKQSLALSNPFSAGPSSLQPEPQDATIKEDSSEISSYVSPYVTDDETSGRVLSVPPLAAVAPPEELQSSHSLPFLPAPPTTVPSSSSPPTGIVVMGLASPRVYDWINMRGAPKVMPSWGFSKKP